MNKFCIGLLLSILASTSLYSQEKITCSYGVKDSCPQDMYCAYQLQDKPAVCLKSFTGKIPAIYFPYGKRNRVSCYKATDPNTDSSHAWENARYAADLHTLKISQNKIYAGLDGKIVSATGCGLNDHKCNSWFGNQVKILAQNGIMLFYAHLSKVNVKTGDIVKAGDLIGREGATGASGDLAHLHVSVHYNWNNLSLESLDSTYPDLPSIPFKLKVCDPKIKSKCSRIKLDIRDLKCWKTHSGDSTVIGSGL